MKTKHRCHAVKGDMRRESGGFKGVINVFTVVLSAARTGYRQRHSARGGRREIKMIPNTWGDISLTTKGYSTMVKQSKGCKSKWFVYSGSSSCKCNRPLCHLPSNNIVCLEKVSLSRSNLSWKKLYMRTCMKGNCWSPANALKDFANFFGGPLEDFRKKNQHLRTLSAPFA